MCMARPFAIAGRWLAVSVLSLAAAFPAAAGNFSVSPIRVELSQAQATAVVTVHNQDTAPLVIQVSALSWSQPEGEETYGETRDLLITRPVFTVQPDSDQIVRVALRRQPDETRELAYRVLLAEVPQPASVDFTGLRVALRLSLPVFVRPSVPTEADIAWSAKRMADGSLKVSATNKGTAHAQITDFEVRFPGIADSAKVQVTRYVLPGNEVSWNVKPPAAAAGTPGATISGFSNAGEFSADLTIAGL